MRLRFPSAVFAPDGDGAVAPVVTEAPAVAAPVSPSPAPAEAAPPVEAAAPAPVPAAVEAPAPAAPAIVPSLLEQGATPPAPAEAEGATPAADEAAPASTDAPAEEAPAPYELAVPEGFDAANLDAEQFGALKTILAETKVPVEKGQELLNMHVQELGRVAEAVRTNMYEQFNAQQAERIAQVKADPELGGNRLNTAMQECLQVVSQFARNEAERTQVIAELSASGMGNSPALLGLLQNIYNRAIKEGSPVPTPPARAPVMSREQRGMSRYNGSAAR